jgi:hypothetical protein
MTSKRRLRTSTFQFVFMPLLTAGATAHAS